MVITLIILYKLLSQSFGDWITHNRTVEPEKMCTRQSRQVIWDMISTLFLTL